LFRQWRVSPPAQHLLACLAAYKGAWKPGSYDEDGSDEETPGIVCSNSNDAWLLNLFSSMPNGSI